MKKKSIISLTLEISYDTATGAFTIDKNTATITSPTQPNIVKMTRKLCASEIKYGILILGSKSHIGRILPLNQDITIIYNGSRYQAHTHATQNGRCDRISSFVKQFKIGSSLQLEYHISTKELYIK